MSSTIEGFKNTEVGIIPEDWDVKAIDKEIDLITGFPFQSAKFVKNGVRLLRGSNVKRSVTDWSEDNTKFWEDVSYELKQYLLKVGDVVIAMDGSLVGKSFARITKNDLPALLVQRIARVRSNKIDEGYLKEFICSDYFTKHCDNVKTASAIPHISPKDIRSFQIPIPPTKAEQTAIATALNDADALITQLEKLIAKKKAMKQGAMQELLKPKEGWETRKLGDIGNFKNGINKPIGDFGFGYPFVNLMDVFGKTNISTNLHLGLINSNSAERKLYDLKEGDVVFIRSSVKPQGVGLTCVIKEDLLDTVFSGFIIRFRDNGALTTSFKEHCFYSTDFRNRLISSSTVSANTNINQVALRDLTISFPKEQEEQNRIASILSGMDLEILKLEVRLEKQKQLKQGMMQSLLTGKIRLV